MINLTYVSVILNNKMTGVKAADIIKRPLMFGVIGRKLRLIDIQMIVLSLSKQHIHEYFLGLFDMFFLLRKVIKTAIF